MSDFLASLLAKAAFIALEAILVHLVRSLLQALARRGGLQPV